MSVRPQTLTKYIEAVGDLERLLLDQDGYVDSHDFTYANSLSAGTLGDLVRAGFLVKTGKSMYRRTSKPITGTNIRKMLEQRDIDRGRIVKPDAKVPAANDPVQTKLDLVQPVKPATVSRADYEALERRVASLEQLMIRRGVA